MSEAKQWCNRIYVMLAGRAIEVRKLDLSKHEPQHPYVLLFDPWGSPLPEKELSKEGCPFNSNCPIVLQSKCTQELPTLTQISDGHSYLVMHLCTIPINLHLNPENLMSVLPLMVFVQFANATSIEEEQAEMARILEDMKQFREKAI